MKDSPNANAVCITLGNKTDEEGKEHQNKLPLVEGVEPHLNRSAHMITK